MITDALNDLYERVEKLEKSPTRHYDDGFKYEQFLAGQDETNKEAAEKIHQFQINNLKREQIADMSKKDEVIAKLKQLLRFDEVNEKEAYERGKKEGYREGYKDGVHITRYQITECLKKSEEK